MKIVGAGRRLRKFFDDTLTDEMIWEEIIHQERLNNIHQLKTISPEAAKVMIHLERRLELLSLGITSLSAEVAHELVQYQGEIILLNCVHELKPDAAAALATYRGGKLGLNGLKRISIDALKGLSAYQGTLMLDSLEEIIIKDKREAEQVFKHLEVGRLTLNSLKRPPISLLRLLARIPAPLELDGIRELPASQAAVLISHKGKELRLRGLKEITPGLLKMLAKYKGKIDISWAKQVDMEALALLAQVPREKFMLHRRIRKLLAQYRQLKAQKEKEWMEERQRKIAEEEKKHLEAQEKARALLKEFEKFDQLGLTQQQVEAVEEIEEEYEEEKSPEQLEREKTEAQMNFEITRKKNHLNELLRKGPDNVTPEEEQEIATLRKDIQFLKDEIRQLLDLLVEGREVGAVVFNSSDDLVKYLQESGTGDDEDDALAKLEDEDYDMFGSWDAADEEEAEAVPLEDEPVEEIIEGDGFAFRPAED